jgi:predicted RNA-binding protein with PIN domain
MPYIVDGNNVMAHVFGRTDGRSDARRQLIDALARFVAVNRVKVTVVFDGAPDDSFPDGSTFRSVRILYATRGSDADTRIKDLVRKSTAKRDLTVISSDKAVVSHAAHHGARVLTGQRFGRLLDEAAIAAPEKPEGRSSDEIDEWLRYFSGGKH